MSRPLAAGRAGAVRREAMIFAAGEGRRLRPLTDSTPKALVDVAGKSALQRVFDAVVGGGATHIVINAHHHADQVQNALIGITWPGLAVTLLREDLVSDRPLETGGGLAHARASFVGNGPIILHNADILTDLDLDKVVTAHEDGRARDGRLATLVVTRRPTTRPLVVDSLGVYARINRTEGWEVVAREPVDDGVEVGFAGIHVLDPSILEQFEETGVYSIIDVYVRLIQAGHVIGHFDATDSTWHDIGTPARLEAAREWAARQDEGA